MAYQDFIKVGKYYRFSLFLYSFKKDHYYLSEKQIVPFLQKSILNGQKMRGYSK